MRVQHEHYPAHSSTYATRIDLYRLWIKLIVIISLVGVAVGPGHFYQNDYMEDLMVECPSGYGLSSVESRYIAGMTVDGDRLWNWYCEKVYNADIAASLSRTRINERAR